MQGQLHYSRICILHLLGELLANAYRVQDISIPTLNIEFGVVLSWALFSNHARRVWGTPMRLSKGPK